MDRRFSGSWKPALWVLLAAFNDKKEEARKNDGPPPPEVL
jgi:hypothetical protein